MESNGKSTAIASTTKQGCVLLLFLVEETLTNASYASTAHHLGRSWQERPTLVLSTRAPGHEAHPRRLPRASDVAQPAAGTEPPPDPALQLLRSAGGTRVREDGGASAARTWPERVPGAGEE